MKTQLLQDLQESGSTPPAAGESVPAAGPPRRKPIVLVDDARTPTIEPPRRPAPSADEARTPTVQPPAPSADEAHALSIQRPALPADEPHAPSIQRPATPADEPHAPSIERPAPRADEARTPSIQPPATLADRARTPPDRPHRPAVWHGPAAQRVDAGTPGQRLEPRAAPRARDIPARGAGVAIEAWAERAALAGAGESRPVPAQPSGGVPGTERPTMDVAAFFGRDERPGVVRATGHESAAPPPPRAAASDDLAPGQHVAPTPVAAPPISPHDAAAAAAVVPHRPHVNDAPPLGADPDDTTLLRTDVPGMAAGERVPAAQQQVTPPAAVSGMPAREHAAAPLPPAAARASVPEPMLQKATAPFPAAAALPESPWRRLWKRRVVAWSAAGVLAAAVGGAAGWLIAGSHDESTLVAADTVPAVAARGAQAYAAREPAATVKAAPATPAPEPPPPSAASAESAPAGSAKPPPAAEPAPVSAPPSGAPVGAVKPPPPAEPVVRPAPPAPAPDVAPAASRSVATVDLAPPKHAAHRATAVRKRAAAKIRRAPLAETPPVVTEPSPRERREETLMQCRAHGYDERQCIRRGCAMTRYGFACRG